jgi:ATP-dependent Clp protease ATP-binding subunit ClpB
MESLLRNSDSREYKVMAKKQEKAIRKLDLTLSHPAVQALDDALRSCIIAQDRAVRSITSLYQILQAGLNDQTRPLGTMLFLGPTGSGKTRVVEAAAEALFGDQKAIVKIDCAEFQHSHEIAKLIGSPPGYLGHRETPPLLTQENINKFQTERNPFTLILFDEIEKASDSLWQLLLGVLDKAVLTLGDNRRVDFSQTMIFMTSNIGARDMSELISGSIGFAPARGAHQEPSDLSQKIYRTASEAARKRFSPEFMNRIDKIVVFHSLTHQELYKILSLELRAVQRRINEGAGQKFTFTLTEEAKQFLLTKGTDYRYGARHLKRSIERLIVYPLASLVSSEQVREGHTVIIEYDELANRLVFMRSDQQADAAQGILNNAVPASQEAGAGYIAA